jgi:hypothetical protein
MNRTLLTQIVIAGLLLLLTASDIAYHYPRLPEQVPTHFGLTGQPDAWSSRQAFLLGAILVPTVLVLFFSGLAFAMLKVPLRFLNVPRREYWLAPEREDYTRRMIGELIIWLGLTMLATLSALNHSIMRASLTSSPNLGSWPWWILAGNLAMTLILIGASTWRFRRVARANRGRRP